MQKHHTTLELHKVLQQLASHCVSPDAKAQALEQEPATEPSVVAAWLEQTTSAHNLLARFGSPGFGGLTPVGNALHRAKAGASLQLSELLGIARTLRVFAGIAHWYQNSGSSTGALQAWFEGVQPNSFLEEAIRTAVQSEDALADTASPALADLRRKIRQQELAVRQRLEDMTRSAHYSKCLQESLVTMRGGRFVLPVKVEHRAEIPGLVHDSSASGATVFIEPMAVVEANNEIRVLQGKEREECARIVAALSAQAGEFHGSVQQSYTHAVQLDLQFAKANLGYAMRAVAPQLTSNGVVELHRARHPLLHKDTVVPINIALGESFDTLMITGPNTGGKTVSLKTLGLLCLMAACGLMIPAESGSRVAVFAAVLVDIGDEQSIEQSLSTFSSHMVNLISIVQQANAQSLVLIDELGAGTDPIEGAALAAAIIETLRGQGARVAATTHYAELKTYALQTPGVQNASFAFDLTTMRPTYQLQMGAPGRSNAFAISAHLGLPEPIIALAQSYVSGEHNRFEQSLQKLEERQSAAAAALHQAEQTQRAANQALQQAEAERQQMHEQRTAVLEEARAAGRAIAEATRAQAFAFAAELDRLKKEASTATDKTEWLRRARAATKKGLIALNDTEGQAAPAAPTTEPTPETAESFRKGDRVRVRDLQLEGEVLEPPNAKGLTQVQAGAMSLRTPWTNLQHLGAPVPEPAARGRRRQVVAKEDRRASAPPAQLTRLDLRGMPVEECLLELDRQLDAALRTGLHELTVIHGKGTGALRKAVRQHLKTCKAVQGQRPGMFGEGEDGVTIVSL